MRRKSTLLVVSLVLATIILGTLNTPVSTPPFPSSPGSLGQFPLKSFAPPSNQPGNGYDMSLTSSVNGWQAWNLEANNTRADTKDHNKTFFNSPPPLAWQNIKISNLTATNDARAVESGPNDGFVSASGASTFQGFAMRFTTVEKVNITGVWLYYRLPSPLAIEIRSTGTTNSTVPPSGGTIGTGTLQGTSGLFVWGYVKLDSPVTLSAGNYYWLVIDASSLSGGAFFDWSYKYDGALPNDQDRKFASAEIGVGSWFDEVTLRSNVGHYVNFLLVLNVLPVDESGTHAMTYNIPTKVDMWLNRTLSSPIQIVSNTTRVPNSYRTFVCSTNTSVTFTANWTARMEALPVNQVATQYSARDSFTLWNSSFLGGGRPVNPYTWYNLTFKVTTVPQFWSQTSPPTNITNTRGYPFTFSSGSGYYLITQTNDINLPGNWMPSNWLISSRSSYKISSSMPKQVVAGLPLTVSVATTPYSSSWCNISFFDHVDHIEYTRNITITGSSDQLTLKLNRSDLYTLFLFDKWTGGNEASLNRTLTVNVLQPLSNITVNDRTSPVISKTGALRFKFYNNSLGTGNTWIQPQSVSLNGTLTTDYIYDGVSGNITLYMNTASGGWRTGNNTIIVSSSSGVFNATKQTWIIVQRPLCNVTVIIVNSPILGNPATAQFRFLNGTNGWQAMQPATVMINRTAPLLVTYASGVTTVSWSTASGGWRSGNNYVNITAISGLFINSTVYQFTIKAPNAKLTLNSTLYAATYGDGIPIGFTFFNITGAQKPFPSPPTLYRNGTVVGLIDLGGGSYAYLLSTYYFSQSGVYHLNFTAVYGTYMAINITTVALSKIAMSLSIQTPQTSVTIGSSLSVSATLHYGNGTLAHDGFVVQFDFTVTYANGSIVTISKTAVTSNGVALSSLYATSDMKSINIRASYAGSGITDLASDLKQNIQVVAGQGLSLMTIALIGGGGGALVVALVGILKYRGRRKRTEVTKTKALVQTASLAQLIVVHLASGRALYSRSIGSEEGADPNLISGFLSANQSIITEVFKKQPGAGLKFADYGEYKVVSNVGNYVMATLFCTETAGEELQGILQSFTEKFEKKYAPVLHSWDGNMSAFKDADNIADDVFSLPLCSPYMLLDTQISKLSRDERAAVHSARILSGERGVFFMPRVVDFLLTKQNLKRGKAMDVINSLTKKGVFRQLTIEQAAQVVKSTTEQAGNQA